MGTNVNSDILALKCEKDGFIYYANDAPDKARMLNDLFVSITNINDENVVFPDQAPVTDASLDHIVLTLDDVIKSIQSFPSNKSPEPDGISPIVLKATVATLAPILLRLFNKSLILSIFPSV